MMRNIVFTLAVSATWPLQPQTVQARLDTNRVAYIEVEVENSRVYRFDVSDPAQNGTSTAPAPPRSAQPFTDFCQIDDVVRINGKPAKGHHTTCGVRMNYRVDGAPGSTITDVPILGSAQHMCSWELYSSDSRFVGRIVDGGFFPHSVLGGAGAFFGAAGEHHFSGGPEPVASSLEDPALRRVYGGSAYKVMFYVVPRFWPEIVVEQQGPAVYRADRLNAPLAGQAVRAGDVLTMKVKGLGPTYPGPTTAGPVPPGTRAFASEAPYDRVSSPIEVTLNGVQAEVINAIGWPGTTDVYRVDFRVPDGLSVGSGRLRVTSAWIDSDDVAVVVTDR